jgi:hypothetical protein
MLLLKRPPLPAVVDAGLFDLDGADACLERATGHPAVADDHAPALHVDGRLVGLDVIRNLRVQRHARHPARPVTQGLVQGRPGRLSDSHFQVRNVTLTHERILHLALTRGPV